MWSNSHQLTSFHCAMHHWAIPPGLLSTKPPGSGTTASFWRGNSPRWETPTALKPHVKSTTPSIIIAFLPQTTHPCQLTCKYQTAHHQWSSTLAKSSSEKDSYCIDCRFPTACLIVPIFGLRAPRVEGSAFCDFRPNISIRSMSNHTAKSTS